MIFITHVDIREIQQLRGDNISLDNGNATVSRGCPDGILKIPQIEAKDALKWIGLEILPSERGIEIGIRKDEMPRKWNGNLFVESEVDVFFPLDEFREKLKYWSGPCQFVIKLNPESQVRSIKWAFDANCSLEYVINCFSFLLSRPVQLSRLAESNSDGTLIPAPVDLDWQRVSDIEILCAGHPPTSGVQQDNAIVLASPIPRKICTLRIAFSPPVALQLGIFQVSSVPQVLVRTIEEENPKQINARDHIRTGVNQSKVWEAAIQFDQVLEIEVIARSLQDAQDIASSLYARLNGEGGFPLPAIDTFQVVFPRGPIKKGAEVQNQDGTVTLKFEVVMPGMIEAEETTTEGIFTDVEVKGLPQL